MIERYKKDEQITINQHYVPRFYMKNFSTIKKSKKEEKVLIGFYQFNQSLLKNNIPIKSICSEDYFYGEDGKIEKYLSTKETKWAKVIYDIINTNEYNLDSLQENLIKEFAVFQYCRTLGTYNYQKDMMSEMLQKLVSYEVHDVDDEIVRSMVNEKVQNEWCTSDIIDMCDSLVESIDDLNISIIRFDTTSKLITSDMPIIIINPFCPDTVGLETVGIVILFPVSPNVIVVIYDGKIYNSCRPYMVIDKEEDVINLNKYQVISAEERIMSKNQNELKTIISDSNLILKRNEYNKNRKVNTGFDGRGTIIHTKSRSIGYDFELSFCKLPKYINKIPNNCRVPSQRKYNEESRISLLFRVYSLPELIKQNEDLTELDISKFKDGYKQMQRFMDDYWGIPVKDRIITPELMYKLKNSSATFFDCGN